MEEVVLKSMEFFQKLKGFVIDNECHFRSIENFGECIAVIGSEIDTLNMLLNEEVDV